LCKISKTEKDIFDRVKQGKINFFVGAGISKEAPAKLPTGPALTQKLLDAWIFDKDTLDLLIPYAQNGTLRLEVVMQIARETFSGRNIVLDPLLSLIKGSPNDNHYLLAFALRKGCTVITTNFDIHIEIAYWNLYGSIPQAIISDSLVQTMVLRGLLIKIHGSIAILERISNTELLVRDSRETVMAALDQVAQGLGDNKTSTLQQLLQHAPTLFWGYSCMDDFDIFPVLSSTEGREVFYWLFFEEDKSLELLSETDWNSFVSEIYSRSHLEDPKRFEIENVSSTLSSRDFRLYGDISPRIKQVRKLWHLNTQKNFEMPINSQLGIFCESMRKVRKQKPKTWETQLFSARVLGHVGEWNDKMHTLYSAVYNNTLLEPDFRLKVRIEHADRTTPNDLSKALEIINRRQDGYKGASDDTIACALATTSNIKRRQKQKDAENFIQNAVEMIQQGNVNGQTISIVSHYQALLFHQEIAEEVKQLKRDSELKTDFLEKIRKCQELFSKGSTFFKSRGLIDYFAMSQNGLALLLLEKGMALKIVGQIEEANRIFENAANILLENVAVTRMRYGFFRGVGQAYRNIALARQKQENYQGTLDALNKAAYFYSKVKPTPPPTDLFEVYYRQAETLVKTGEHEKALQPILRWILQKRALADWHDEARGLKVLSEALRGMGFYLDAGYTVKLILDIYRDVFDDEAKRYILKNRRFGLENANDNLIFAQQLAKDLGRQEQERDASTLLIQLDTL
jgi:tetratricopeptide (TPR) repeat protein